jgi:hypothetical protein
MGRHARSSSRPRSARASPLRPTRRTPRPGPSHQYFRTLPQPHVRRPARLAPGPCLPPRATGHGGTLLGVRNVIGSPCPSGQGILTSMAFTAGWAPGQPWYAQVGQQPWTASPPAGLVAVTDACAIASSACHVARSAARWLFTRQQATAPDASVAPYKRRVVGSNPVAPTFFECLSRAILNAWTRFPGSCGIPS